MSRFGIGYEIWHRFTKKNGINFGLGWLYAPKEEKLLPFFVENGTKLRPRFGCTDGLASYQGIIPRRKHKISKKLTQTIESINATFRPYLARFHRKTKCYSKSKTMVFKTILLFANKSIVF